MASIGSIRSAVWILFLAWVYRNYLHPYVQLLGVNRTVKSLSDYPIECRRINDPELQACEDMWFDESSKLLYLACSTVKIRKHWNPNIGLLTAPTSDKDQRVVVVDTTKPRGDTYSHRRLDIKNIGSLFYPLSITGFKAGSSDAKAKGKVNANANSRKLQFYIVNNKPTVDAAGKLTDNSVTGASESIELFEHDSGSNDLVHVRTFEHPLITTPNNIAVASDGGFFFTNDHGPHKTGLIAEMAPYLHAGNISHCNPGTPTDCTIVSTLHSFPNGIVIPSSHPNLLFVASAALGRAIRVYEIQPATPSPSSNHNHNHPVLKLRQKIPVDVPIDNLRYDEVTKSIYAPGFPRVLESIKQLKNTTHNHQISGPGRVLRIFEEKNLVDGSKWVAETVLEDGNGDVLPDCTTVVRAGDAIWLGGVASPFVTVCEPKRRI